MSLLHNQALLTLSAWGETRWRARGGHRTSSCGLPVPEPFWEGTVEDFLWTYFHIIVPVAVGCRFDEERGSSEGPSSLEISTTKPVLTPLNKGGRRLVGKPSFFPFGGGPHERWIKYSRTLQKHLFWISLESTQCYLGHFLNFSFTTYLNFIQI